MKHPDVHILEDFRSYLLSKNNLKKLSQQKKARQLLLGDYSFESDLNIADLKALLSESSEILKPDPVQQRIFNNDTGTHIIPEFFKKRFINNKLSFIVRPGSIEDCSKFIKWAFDKKLTYSVRGAGTWPFGGSVPINNDIVLDLSYLDFHQLFPETDTLVCAAGFLFPDARNYLKENGYSLCQEITNPNSGTIAGWVATGGLGLGSYKYGEIKNNIYLQQQTLKK